MYSQLDLKRHVATFPSFLPRTYALEQSIRIGVGFHDKWYGSQKEHWLGWLKSKECESALQGEDFSKAPASLRWRNLSCAPMMVWLAEAAGVRDDLLDRAEAAAVAAAAEVGHDHASHGKAIRAVLPWLVLEKALGALLPVDEARAAEADAEADAAFMRLVSKVPKFRLLYERCNGGRRGAAA